MLTTDVVSRLAENLGHAQAQVRQGDGVHGVAWAKAVVGGVVAGGVGVGEALDGGAGDVDDPEFGDIGAGVARQLDVQVAGERGVGDFDNEQDVRWGSAGVRADRVPGARSGPAGTRRAR